MSVVSVIIPVLNEADVIERTLRSLQPMIGRGHEVIVVDGGSDDDTVARSRSLSSRMIGAPRGRARQMQAGADIATGDVLWFLHADTLPPDNADRLILDGLHENGYQWGRFDIHIESDGILLRLVARMMNLRSRLSSIATGDQGIFVEKALFMRAGGYPDIDLMEDIELCRQLKREGRPLCLQERVSTSSRRWRMHGVVRTIFLMWFLRAAHAMGVEPGRLARYYGM